MKGIGVLGFFALAGSSFATESFLIAIPIADILGHRELAYTLSANGYEGRVSSGYDWTSSLEFGLNDRVEFGFDSTLTGTTLYNFKWQAASASNWAVSFGINGIDTCTRSQGHYVVGRYDLARTRFHAGVLRSDRSRAIYGLDHDLGKGYSLMVDTTIGARGITWAALNIPAGPLVFTLAGGVPNDHRDGVQHMASVTAMYRF